MGKHRHLLCCVSDKGPGLRLKLLLMSQLNPQSTCSLHNPLQVRFQNIFIVDRNTDRLLSHAKVMSSKI